MAAERIKTGNQRPLNLQIFPSSQLGSDTDTLSQLRSGGSSSSPLRTDPGDPGAARLDQRRRLRFQGLRQVWGAMDGKLGALSAARSPRAGWSRWTVSGTMAFARSPPAPSRSSRRETSRASRFACRSRPLWTSMFKAFGASPASINFNEVYSALQTKSSTARRTRWRSSTPPNSTKCRNTAR